MRVNLFSLGRPEESMVHSLMKQAVSVRINVKLANSLWDVLSSTALNHLKKLTKASGTVGA
jgi:hypothetical protein